MILIICLSDLGNILAYRVIRLSDLGNILAYYLDKTTLLYKYCITILTNMFWPFSFLAAKSFKLFGFPIFWLWTYSTRWRVFQKCIVGIKLDIYVFIHPFKPCHRPYILTKKNLIINIMSFGVLLYQFSDECNYQKY